MDEKISGSFLSLLDQVLQVTLSNHNIWIPVLAAWAAGFIYTRYLNGKHVRRRSDREFRVYMINLVTAFALYALFNIRTNIIELAQQATLAAAVAVLIPAGWFWWRGRATEKR